MHLISNNNCASVKRWSEHTVKCLKGLGTNLTLIIQFVLAYKGFVTKPLT